MRSKYGRKNRTNIKRQKWKNGHQIKLNENHFNYETVGNNRSELKNNTNNFNNTLLPKEEESDNRTNNTAVTDNFFNSLLADPQNDKHNRIHSNNTALVRQSKADANNKKHIVENYNTIIVHRDNSKAQESQEESKCPQTCICNKTTEIIQDNPILQQNNSKVQPRQGKTSLTKTKTSRPRKQSTKPTVS